MTTKAVQFSVEVKNVVITSGTYEVLSSVDGHAAATKTAFQGNTFSVEIKENDSHYFAVTVCIQSYTSNGVTQILNENNKSSGELPFAFG